MLNLIETKGDTLQLQISGRLDSEAARQLEKELSPLLESRYRMVICDLSCVTYASSVVLRVFIATGKTVRKNDGELRFTAVPAPIQKVFELAGFNSIFHIEGDPAPPASAVKE